MQFDTHEAQARLYGTYVGMLRPYDPEAVTPDNLEPESLRAFEDAWLNSEDHRAAAFGLPSDRNEFRAWFESATRKHIEDVAPIFDHLRSRASLDELALYTCLYGEVDDHFVDLVALAQLGMPPLAKITIGENIWDELGRGQLEGMHIVLFRRAIAWSRVHLGKQAPPAAHPMRESLKNSNLLLLFGLRRPLAPRLLGALGIQESSGTPRFAAVAAGLERFSVGPDVLEYYRVHAECDDRHGEEWYERVLEPIVHASPLVMRQVALGVLNHLSVAVDHYRAIARRLPQVRAAA